MTRSQTFNIFTCFMIALFCGLGFWQLQRLELKLTLLSNLDAARNADEVLTTPQKLDENFIFHKARVSGQLTGTWLRLYQYNKGRVSYRWFTLLKAADEDYLLLDVGPAPLPLNVDMATDQSFEFSGVVWPSSPSTGLSSWFAEPPQQGEDGVQTWYHVSPEGMMTALGAPSLQNEPRIYLRLTRHPTTGAAINIGPRPKLSNNHVQYAITWFSLAFALAFIWLVGKISSYMRRPQNTLVK